MIQTVLKHNLTIAEYIYTHYVNKTSNHVVNELGTTTHILSENYRDVGKSTYVIVEIPL